MNIAINLISVVIAAACVWLVVRVINRRERWAKRTLAGMLVGIPVLYVASVWPALWISSRYQPTGKPVLPQYRPLAALVRRMPRTMRGRIGDFLLSATPEGSNLIFAPEAILVLRQHE